MTLDSQTTSATIYKQLFTDSEWDAISSAMGDYSDYGNEEAMIADSIQAKIATIYRLTSNWFFLMQLTSKDGNMVVDFYPVKFATGEIHNRLMLKVVTFMGKTQSKRYINKKDFQYEFDSCTHGYGYQVTDESMIPQLFNSGMACAC